LSWDRPARSVEWGSRLFRISNMERDGSLATPDPLKSTFVAY
jgi:hypothetical protein